MRTYPAPGPSSVNHRLLSRLNPDEVDVVMRQVDEAEVDDM